MTIKVMIIQKVANRAHEPAQSFASAKLETCVKQQENIQLSLSPWSM